MYKYAARISYVGTRYLGWQKQRFADGVDPGALPVDSADEGLMNPKDDPGSRARPRGVPAKNGHSIQDTIETAVREMTGETVSVIGSGRTDSGVHAMSQYTHFTLKNRNWDCAILRKGLNSRLPTDIRILDVRPAPADFHSQRSAEKKQYSYYFQQGLCSLPSHSRFSWWIQKRLDREAMQTALDVLVGRHDFKAFQASGSKARTGSVRRILSAEITWVPIEFPGGMESPETGFGLVRVRLVGTGFLKQMVRGIVGTLVQIGEGRRPASCMKEILESKDRSAVGPTAPAHGLWLERVWYPLPFSTLFD